MVRAMEFDPDAALRAALGLFWERGYEATSMSDLVERPGIGRAGLYATFGGRHELYLRALRRHREVRRPLYMETLSRPGPALPAVRELVEGYVRDSVGDAGRRGCMIGNEAEMLPGDERVARCVPASVPDARRQEAGYVTLD